MSKIIIAVHGLGNKPEPALYSEWWERSILDGLEAIGVKKFSLEFELVYWADILYPKPLDRFEKDTDNSLYIKEPYVPRENIPEKEAVEVKTAVYDQIIKQMEKIVFTTTSFLNIDVISNSIVRHWFTELDAYYNSPHKMPGDIERPLREIIRDRLVRVLYKHRKKEIMLISQSMGSIIAYDVLSVIPEDVRVHTFVTCGSPLGLPIVVKKLIQERGDGIPGEASTPGSVKRAWYNILDENDTITLGYRLADFYKENPGGVKVVDKITFNRYEYNGLKNPHRGYGYLMTPEVADVVRNFLGDEKGSLFKKLKQGLEKYILRKKR